MTQSNKSLSERLLRYSAVASLTASSAVLLGPMPASATIIDVNCTMDAGGELCEIDFDDGGTTPEFTLALDTSSPSYLWLYASTHGSDLGWSFASSGWSQGYALVARVVSGATISSPAFSWSSSTQALLHSGSGAGVWSAPISKGYIAVRFNLDGSGLYYGWIELDIPTNGEVTVTRIGYNTTVGGSIPAAIQLSDANATTGSRGVVAAGLAGLSGALLWLKRKFAGL